MRRGIRRFMALSLTAILLTGLSSTQALAEKKNHLEWNRVKNVIVMVPDGCSASVQTLARWFKGEPLNLDGLNAGSVQTHMANSVIPGSAAAATAFATGHKTTVRFLGVGPRTDDLLTGLVPTAAPYAPVASVLEGAKLRGKATGLIATSRITHATPAAFASHIHDRNLDNEIMEHMVYENVDVVFGGGARHLIPTDQTYTTSFGDTWKGKREDGENLIQALRDRGYLFVDSRDAMMALSYGPVWGLFDDSHLDPDLDRDDFHPTQPSLAEMTEKAIDLLSQNRKGFFLMVEGSQVDWAGHANDPAYMVTDFLAFDEAVGRALDFAKSDGQTLVLIFPDHNTGALSIGHEQSSFPPGYTDTTVEDLIDPIKKATRTVQGVMAAYPKEPTTEHIAALFQQYWGLTMSDEQAADILALGADSTGVATYISKNFTVFGWTTHGHTGEDVPLWSYGPKRPVGTFDNTDMAKIAASSMRINLEAVSRRLFVDLSDIYPQYTLDKSDPKNPVVRIGANIQLPVSKDIIIKDGVEHRLEGIVVHAPVTNKIYIPGQAVGCILWGRCGL